MRHTFLPIANELQELLCCRGPEGLSLSEDGENFYVDAPLPGVKSEEVNVTLDPKLQKLSICGESGQKRENVKYHLKHSQRYCYEVPLGSSVDFDAEISAVAKDGILSIVLPKSKKSKTHKIPVQVA